MSRRPRRWILPRRRRRDALAVVLAAILLAALSWWNWHNASPPSPSPPEEFPEGTYYVQRVVDGDTLLLTNGARIRLIGANAPETVKPGSPVEPWGPEAKQFTEEFLARGEVRLQVDRERLDKYDRFLAYVWVGDRMLNEELIRAGLARAEPRYRYSESMKTRFRRAEQEAKAAGRGIWSKAAALPAA